MTTTEMSTHFDVIGARIDRLTGQLASSAVGLGPDMIGAMVTDALRRVCEVLEADVATLERLCDDVTGAARRTWVRHGATVGLEPALTIRVAVSGGDDFALSIGMTAGGSPWASVVADSLRALAHVMVLIELRAEQTQELERIKFMSASALDSAPVRVPRPPWLGLG